MNTAIFDTHQAVKAIADSGLQDTQAEAIVATINNAMSQNLATKSDITAVKVDIATVRTELETAIATTRTELETAIAALRTELKADIAALRTELKADIATVTADLLVLKWMVGLIIAAEVLPLLKFLSA